jgi:vacuolar-type H+-ATPase subunit I/STV1
MANLSNSQQTALFRQQSLVNSILSDAAAANAAAQFNATSENQTNQFFSNLAAQVSQFNAAQKNAIDQFNAEEANAVLEFNSALQNQREMFNAQNYLVVAQANAAWRQAINTANTEAQNLSNAQYAKDINGLTQKNLDNYWQQERDIMSFFMAAEESDKDRALRLLLGEMEAEVARDTLNAEEQRDKAAFISNLFYPRNFTNGFFSL